MSMENQQKILTQFFSIRICAKKILKIFENPFILVSYKKVSYKKACILVQKAFVENEDF